MRWVAGWLRDGKDRGVEEAGVESTKTTEQRRRDGQQPVHRILCSWVFIDRDKLFIFRVLWSSSTISLTLPSVWAAIAHFRYCFVSLPWYHFPFLRYVFLFFFIYLASREESSSPDRNHRFSTSAREPELKPDTYGNKRQTKRLVSIRPH